MKVHVQSLKPGENLLESGEKDAWVRDLCERVGKQGYPVQGAVRVTSQVTKFEPDLYLQGRLQFRVGFPCARCAEPLEQAIDHSYALALVKVPKGKIAEREQDSDNVDVTYFEEDTLDLDPIVEEQFFLSLPYQALCKKDCKGICQTCGQNRNQAACSCPQESAETPFSVLKQWKV